jgi:thiosulfate/3-mercaptopyruvate sulfurtransferase
MLNLALARIGHPGVALYDGSWAEWGLPGGGPLQIG